MFLFLFLQIWFHEIFFSIWIFENLQILTHLIFNDLILILEFLFLSYFRFLEILYFIPSSLSLLEI